MPPAPLDTTTRRGVHTSAAAWAVCVAAWFASPVRADEADTSTRSAADGSAARDGYSPSSDAGGYAEAIEAGLVEYDLGHYQEARAHFLRAHELAPSARTLRALGNVDFELRNYGDCVSHLQQALDSDEKPLQGKLREDTEKLLARARVYVGELHVSVEPGSATVSVDGVVVGRGPESAMALLVGEHVLEFRAQGRLSERRSVHIRGGETVVLEVVLREMPGVAAAEWRPRPSPQPGPEMRRDHVKPLRTRWWLWTSVGAVVAAVGAGIAVGVSQRSDPPSMRASMGSLDTTLRAP